MLYLWLKSFHIVFVVTWFAGLFYIFRLFVYHAQHKDYEVIAAAYSTMERKLLYGIMHPSMFLTIVFGSLLAAMNPDILNQHWFHAKIGAVLVLVAYQIYAGIIQSRFARGNYCLSERACRWINEMPGILLVAIVLLVTFRPWI